MRKLIFLLICYIMTKGMYISFISSISSVFSSTALSLDVSSIRCYECNTHEQRRECGDPFNHLGVGVKECSDLNTDPVHMCYKSSHYSEYNWYFLLMYAVPMYICFRWWKIPYCSRLCSFRYKLFYTSMASGNGWNLLERIQ